MQPTQAYHQVLRQNIGKNSYVSRKCQGGLNVFFGHGEIFSVGIRDWQRKKASQCHSSAFAKFQKNQVRTVLIDATYWFYCLQRSKQQLHSANDST